MTERKGTTRKYELRQRADAMNETRLRITEATVELHGTIGPARTTVAGIAERAGVQRHTVYRHFPDDDELFAACSNYYWQRHPWPDPESWTTVVDRDRRFTVALGQLYEFYAEVEPMLNNVLRDAEEVPATEKALADYYAYLDEVTQALLDCHTPARGRRRLTEAAIRHAIAFRTWQSLVRQNRISSNQAARLMCATASAAAHKSTP